MSSGSWSTRHTRVVETHLRHRITPDGFYRGRKVIDKPVAEEGQE